MFDLHRDAPTSLAEQVADGLAGLIARGEWLPGARLPSVRQLAAQLSVSAFTVMAALDRLAARRLLEARPGAGHFVTTPEAAAPAAAVPEMAAADPADPIGFALQSFDNAASGLRSASGFLPTEWLDEAVPAALVARVVRSSGALSTPAPVQGSRGLREQVAERLASLGLAATPQQIVTTVGASQGLDLLLRALARPGDRVLVEDPGYFFHAAQARALDLQVLPLPRRADGPDLDALEDLLQRHHPKVLITQTLLHNPTGGSTASAICHRLLTLAERHGLALIEDDVYGDVAPAGALRLAALDRWQHVHYLGSFSKLLSPALRVGFMVLPPARVEAVVAQKVLSVLASPGLGEAVVEAVLASGRYQRHVQALRQRLAASRQASLTLLRRAGITFDSPAADGFFLWGQLPEGLDSEPLARQALQHGLLLAPGRLFSLRGEGAERLRFNAAHSCEPRLAAFLGSAITAARHGLQAPRRAGTA